MRTTLSVLFTFCHIICYFTFSFSTKLFKLLVRSHVRVHKRGYCVTVEFFAMGPNKPFISLILYTRANGCVTTALFPIIDPIDLFQLTLASNSTHNIPRYKLNPPR